MIIAKEKRATSQVLKPSKVRGEQQESGFPKQHTKSEWRRIVATFMQKRFGSQYWRVKQLSRLAPPVYANSQRWGKTIANFMICG